MRFFVDAQLPPALCDWLVGQGHEAEHVAAVLGGQTPDSTIARYAADTDRVLLTKDDDFLLRHPPVDYRLVWLRCGNITNRGLRAWLDPRWAEVVARLEEGERMVEVR
jgi:predicted nuclease of predicted toxin-antitoxin system